MDLKPARILIGYSSYFALKDFFQVKIRRILSGVNEFQVISLNDNRGFVESLYPDRIVERIPSANVHPREVRRIISDVSHVVLFWDGFDLGEFVYVSALMKKSYRLISVETTKVVNKDKGQEFDVYIGRGTPWGNPFVIGQNGDTRETVIDKFRKYFGSDILSDPSKHSGLMSLRGKRLGCHCKPAACHGDIIAEYLNAVDVAQNEQDESIQFSERAFEIGPTGHSSRVKRQTRLR